MALRQEWYTEDDDEDQLVDDGGAGSTQKLAQTFTLGTTGDNFGFEVLKVWLKINKIAVPTGNVTVTIQEIDPAGAPSGIILSTGTFDIAELTTTATWTAIAMTSTIGLETDREYVLVIDCTTAVVDDFNYLEVRADGTAPAYTGGAMWTAAGGGVGLFVFTEDTSTDIMFQIEGGAYTGTLCSLSECLNKAGVDVNSVARNEILVNEYVKQAEAEINLATRIDWVTAYPTLPPKMQKKLNKTCSSLAAMEMINYDTSVIGSLNAQRKLSLLFFQASEGIKFLNEFDQKNFSEVAT